MTKRVITLTCFLLLLLMSLAACQNGETPPATPGGGGASSDLPDGTELIGQMETAINTIEQAYFNMAFRLATTNGLLEGSIEAWRQQPDRTRYEVTSEAAILNGLVVGSNETQNWAYSPELEVFYVAPDTMGAPFLPGESEARTVLRALDRLQEDGLKESVNATTLGTEEVNGRNTYKVETTFKDVGEPEASLEGVTILFWIDQENSHPHRLEFQMKEGDMVSGGTIVLQGEIDQSGAIDDSLFSFEPPASARLVDMEQLVNLDFDTTDEDAPPAPSEDGEVTEGTFEEGSE